MQGRLLPKYQGRYQAHPCGYWHQEFPIAQSVGLNCIEFILDYDDAEKNPLMSTTGIASIQQHIDETGVYVKTICADYFMEAPLHSEVTDVANHSCDILNRLIVNGANLGVSDIVIPCVDQSSLRGVSATQRFVSRINSCLPTAKEHNINLSLETDLAPEPFLELLDQIGSEHVKVNYDIGNSAALGYNPIEELNTYGHLISDIHIKDRVLNGGPVVLGKGNAQFKEFFDELAKFNYEGPFIMQAYRDDEGVDIFKKQFAWISDFLKS
ncbi:MAG: sugar phosphate isomerase/epimerase [Gammaproteobacteria bacterium]|nr:sugar phosphate isomerase/epimerase [Gammaproteobacteria bacterium]